MNHSRTLSRVRRSSTLLAALAVPLGLGGCLERTIQVTSDPPGALVWVNDVEIGRTPCEAEFTYYGTYDVRLRLDGYEPISTTAEADEPLYEYPPFDLGATVLPWTVHNVVKWHFAMEPALEKSLPPDEFRSGLLDRAHEIRTRIDPSLPE